MSPLRLVCAALIIVATCGLALAADTADQAAIRGALARWTDDFNARKRDAVCDLFEPGLIADFRGEPAQDYTMICDRLKRSLGDDTRSYHYASDIKEILVFGDMAVVRLVWTLTISGAGMPEVKSVEPGMDVFRREPDGSWKIMRYMAYSE